MKYLTALLTGICLLTISGVTLAQEDIRYTIDELKQLNQQGNYKEALSHLQDVPPNLRNTDWQATVTNTVTGLVETYTLIGVPFEILGLGMDLQGDYPFLFKNSKLMSQMFDTTLGAVPICATTVTTDCLNYLMPFMAEHKASPVLAQRLVKQLEMQSNVKASDFIQLYAVSVKNGDSDICRLQKLQQAVANSASSLVPSKRIRAKEIVHSCKSVDMKIVQKAIRDSELAQVTLCKLMSKNGQLNDISQMVCREANQL